MVKKFYGACFTLTGINAGSHDVDHGVAFSRLASPGSLAKLAPSFYKSFRILGMMAQALPGWSKSGRAMKLKMSLRGFQPLCRAYPGPVMRCCTGKRIPDKWAACVTSDLHQSDIILRVVSASLDYEKESYYQINKFLEHFLSVSYKEILKRKEEVQRLDLREVYAIWTCV